MIKKQNTWELHPTKAIGYLSRNKQGETWRDLCTDYFNQTGKEDQLDDTGKAPADSKEVFRRVVDKEARKHPEYNEIVKSSIQEGLGELIKYDENAPLTQDAIYKILNISPDEFKLVGKFKVGGWGALTVGEAQQRFANGSISLFFEPREYVFNQDKFEDLLKSIKPVKVKVKKSSKREGLLLGTVFDPHFPFDTYDSTRDKIMSELMTNKYDEFWFDIGQDWLHNDNRRGMTSSGTPIDKVDMNEAIDKAVAFADPIIKCALENTNRVFLIHSKGNHDEMTGNMLVRILHAMNPQCDADVEDKSYKAYLYKNNAIGLSHGENIRGTKKAKAQRLHDVFMTLFPEIFRIERSRYIFTGHEHNERLIDEAGTLVYTLSTRKPADEWHIKMGFVSAQKRFTIFAFDDVEMVAEFKV